MNSLQTEQHDNILIVTIDTPGEKVNKLDEEMMDQFEGVLDELASNNSLRGAVIRSGKSNNFIAGADINMIRSCKSEEELLKLSQRGGAILKRIQASGKPVVAAIHGACMGGGTELALACHYRILSDSSDTKIALPEVQLGLIPGMGGTQRLPRLIGIQQSLEYLLTGKNFYVRQAKRNGFADEVVYQHKLVDVAKTFILNHQPGTGKENGKPKGWAGRLLEGTHLGRNTIFSQARKKTLARTQGNYPAPLVLIECVKAGYQNGMEAGLRFESESFARLGMTQKSREMVNLFFAMNQAKSNPSDERAHTIERVGVLGAGLMGSGITEVSVDAGYNVWMKDRDLPSAAKGRKAIARNIEKRVDKHIISPFERDQILSRIHATDQYDGFDRLDLVIEAVFEDQSLKQKLFAEVEEIVSPETIIASNTSSIPISQLTEKTKHPERFVGMHYFSPVPKMPLLEIIRTDQTTDEAVATAVRAGRAQGKTVIVVNDGPGFYTTRAVSAYMNEALLLFEEGADIKEIDRSMKDFGFPVGPLTLLDEVGIDIGAHVASVLEGLFDERGGITSKLSARLEEAGYLGRKNGKGFYLYPDDGKKTLNENVYEFRNNGESEVPTADEIHERLSLVMVNEAAWCLGDGILKTPADGDLGAILGLGFPPFTGGPFRYIDQEGADSILKRLEDLIESCGGRFTPAEAIREHEQNNRRFYPNE